LVSNYAMEQVRAEGMLEFRGTLGVAKEVPAGFRSIQLDFDLDTGASDKQLALLNRLTERYRVVYQTLRHTQDTQVTLNNQSAAS
jgi:hypothetical protein